MQIEGRNTVLEALRSSRHRLKVIYLKNNIELDQKLKTIISMAKNKKVRIKNVKKSFLNKMSRTGLHQGIIAIREIEQQPTLPEIIDRVYDHDKQPFFVFIREAQNEYNVGSIIRSAEVTGCQAVILPPKMNLSEQMVRASTGASEHLYITNHSLFQAIKLVKHEGIKVVGIEVGGENFYYEEDLTGPIMFVVGGEDKSLSTEVTSKCDAVVKIPMLGKVNSLNMSIAASIVMMDKIRQESIQK